MNEQEMMINEKIRKREKVDTILAYILLVFLTGAILFILYLKFIKREDTTTPVEKPNNNITLNDISNSLNNSTLANRYFEDRKSTNERKQKYTNHIKPLIGNKQIENITKGASKGVDKLGKKVNEPTHFPRSCMD